MKEHKIVGSVIVTKHSVAGSNAVVYAAYEPSSYFGRHSSLFTIDGQCCGSLPSRRIPEAIEAMRGGSPERCAACDAFRAANESEAYAAIVSAYPEAANGYRSLGEIEVWHA